MKTALQELEEYFGMSFKKIIKNLHWNKQRSINSLAKEAGRSRDVFMKAAARQNLKIMSVKEANKLNRAVGDRHWGTGKTKHNCAMYRRHSERMTKNNPAKNPKLREKMSVGMAMHFKKNPWPQEKKFATILNEANVKHEAQVPIKQYVMDFFIKDLMICIEIDTTKKWGTERRAHAKKRDSLLAKIGIKTIRFDKERIADKQFVLRVLSDNGII